MPQKWSFMISLLLINFLVALNLKSAAAAAGQFYRIKVPVGILNCEQEAAELGQRYSLITNTSPISVSCSGPSKIISENTEYKLFVLDLNYKTPIDYKTQEINTFYYGASFLEGQASNIQGMYSSMKECLTDRPFRVGEFEEQTKAYVLASTCEKATSSTDKSYILRVDTVGTPKVQLFSVNDSEDNFKDEIFKRSTERLINLNNGHIVSHVGGFIYYFAEQTINPRSENFGDMSQTECQEQLGAIQNIVQKHVNGQSIVGCAHYLYGGQNLVSLRALWNHFAYFDMTTPTSTYSDYNECNRDKSRVIVQSQGLGQTVLGAICRLQEKGSNNINGPYEMDIYF